MGIIKTSLVFIGGMFAGGYCVCGAFKDAIAKKTIDMIFGPENNRQQKSRISYASYYETYRKTPPYDRKTATYFVGSCENIMFNSKTDAEYTLDQMKILEKHYGLVSMADLYDLVGLDVPYGANKYGWTSVKKGEVIQCKDGYFIKLPTPIDISRV